MAMPLRSAVAVCSICGEPLKANGNCLACLLRGGLNESIAQSEPLASLVFGDFEIEQRADGFYWELGHGAMGMTYLAMDKVLRRRVALGCGVPVRRFAGCESLLLRDGVG